MGGQVNYSGLVIAGTGFLLTRFTVTLALYEDPLRFFFAGVVPLLLGLGLAAFGVALAVADVDASTVRTTAVWCVGGGAAMLVLVLLTLMGSTAGGPPDLETARSQAYLSNFLIGGSVGGTMTGLYAARNRRHRVEVQRQANRLEVLNRLLRHEVLNAVTVIRGYGSLGPDADAGARDVIDRKSRAIQRTIEEVKYLVRREGSGARGRGAVDLQDCLAASVETVRERHPDATVDVEPVPPGVAVRATERLEQVLVHLLENAIVHAGDPAPTVQVSTAPRTVSVSVRDDGPGLPEQQRALLETGEIHAFDDPGTGFGLNLVRLFVEDFDGSVEADAGPDGTTVTVTLPRWRADVDGPRPLPSGVDGVRPAVPHLVVTLGAALLAGVVYGAVSESLGGSIAGIGVFYGTQSAVVGWLTHEFHSVVFGFVFAGLLTVAPARRRNTLSAHVGIGVAWGFVLFVVAAGIVAPVWLRLMGIPAPFPNLSGPILASHLVWGASLGLVSYVGYGRVAPWLGRLDDRVRVPTWV